MGWWRSLFGGGGNSIEELMARANAFIKEYPLKTSTDQVERAYSYYKKARRIFMQDLHKNVDTPQSTLDNMEKLLSDALQSAPENALLFHKCIELLTSSRSHVNEAQCKWLDKATQRLGKIWPNMLRSYQYTQQAQRSGFLNITLPYIQSHAVHAIHDTHQGGVPGNLVQGLGLESVKACPFNPYAWFSLRFQMHYQGYTTYANALKEIEESLKAVQGQKVLDAIVANDR